MIKMSPRIGALFLLLLILFWPTKDAAGKEPIPQIGPVKLNPHPSDLAGKTILLRWNGKMNGDKYLDYLSNLLVKEYKVIKIIKIWENNPETAIISKKTETSEQIAAKIATMKPDVVIAAQAD